jgi:pilus assembly protein Flp/PilA
MWQWFVTYCRTRPISEKGQGLVEYALILIFVAVVLIAVLTVLSPGISRIYREIIDALESAY